jgi:hypothetical protein
MNTITLALVEIKNEMNELIKRVKTKNAKVGHKLNLMTTKVVCTVKKISIFSDGEHISTVTNYKFLVALITNDSYTNEATTKRISVSKPMGI